MSDTLRIAKLLGLRKHRLAAAYLERHGQQFCVELDTENAIDNARQLWRERQRAYRQKRKARQA